MTRVGSTFDSFLEEEGIKDEVERRAREKGQLHRFLSAIDVLLIAGHVEPARLLIAEMRGGRLEDPGVDPLAALDDLTFEALSERIRTEAFRRERVARPHLGDRWCKLVRRIVVGDVVCFQRAGSQNYTLEREVLSIEEREYDCVQLEFTDGGEGSQHRRGDMMVVKKRDGE